MYIKLNTFVNKKQKKHTSVKTVYLILYRYSDTDNKYNENI